MIEWVKEHPYLAGGLVLSGLLLFLVVRRSSSGASGTVAASGPSESLQALGIQAGTQLQLAQMASVIEQKKIDATQSVYELAASTQLTQTYLNNQTALQALAMQADVTKYGINAELTYGLAQLGIIPGMPSGVVPGGGYNAGSGSVPINTGITPTPGAPITAQISSGPYTQVGSQLYGPSPFLTQEYCGGYNDVNAAYACSLRNQSLWETYMTPKIQAEQQYATLAAQLGPGNWAQVNGQWVNTAA